MSRSEDTMFMSELRAATKRRPRISANLLLLAIIGFLVWAVWWADNAPLDEAARGLGRVIPSSKIQVIQNLEGGIVSKILVRVGERVQKGQPLIIIDDVQFKSKFGEDRSQQFSLQALTIRLRAEVGKRVPDFPQILKDQSPNLVANEIALFEARRNELKMAINVLGRQQAQRQQELVELLSRVTQSAKSLALGQEELDILRPIVEQGATSKVELLRLRREVTDIESTLLAAQQSIPRTQAALDEIKLQILEKKAIFVTRARTELNEADAKLRALRESMTASEDRLRRTEVTSPVHGTVKQVLVNTVGGVVKPGMGLVEIVPLDDSLLVEARVRPSDVAFLKPGQYAKVKITAYDYAIYGMLDAKLEHISADSILDPNSGESFYEIRVQTDYNYLEKGDEKHSIIPGMVAEVDILTGTRTVLQYLLKPILRAQQSALRER